MQHEFTTAEGVIEDITDIVLNVKGLVFSALNDDVEEAVAHLSVEGPCIVTGADLRRSYRVHARSTPSMSSLPSPTAVSWT